MMISKFRRKKLCIAFGLLGLLVVRPLPAASKCNNVPISQLFKTATAVFTGQAAEVKPVEHFLETKFQIREAFKGAANETRVLTYPVNRNT